MHWDNSSERFSALLLWDCSCIISTVSAPPWEWPECSIFPQPSIQTSTITARLQRHFRCTQGLTPVNGGYFQSLCCQSKCQVNTGWQTAPLECFTAVSHSPQLCSAIFHTKTPCSNGKAKMHLCSSYILRWIQKLNYHVLASVCEGMYSEVDDLIWWPKSSAIIRQSEQKHGRDCIGDIDWFSPNNSGCVWHEPTCRQRRKDMRNDCFIWWAYNIGSCDASTVDKATKFKGFISVIYQS